MARPVSHVAFRLSTSSKLPLWAFPSESGERFFAWDVPVEGSGLWRLEWDGFAKMFLFRTPGNWVSYFDTRLEAARGLVLEAGLAKPRAERSKPAVDVPSPVLFQ